MKAAFILLPVHPVQHLKHLKKAMEEVASRLRRPAAKLKRPAVKLALSSALCLVLVIASMFGALVPPADQNGVLSSNDLQSVEDRFFSSSDVDDIDRRAEAELENREAAKALAESDGLPTQSLAE